MKTAEEFVSTARNAFQSGRTKSLDFREKQLLALLRLYEENTQEMIDALKEDLRKSKQEAIISEIDYLKNELRGLLYNFRSWAKPEKVLDKGIPNLLDGTILYPEPYGVVLVIGAWNYPLQLTLMPAAGAIAAGNCVIMKPSEVAPVSAKLMAELIPKYLDTECYQVYLGGVPETTALLQQRFDYIFFTGSTAVGKIVHQAASKHLTPTTLELGGKSPVYLDKSADLEIAARRIMWGKCFNAGQSCIAPDYLLCTKEVGERFVKEAEKALKDWYGEKIKQSPDFGRIISDAHFKRVVALLSGSGKVVLGGDYDASERYVAPTILVDVKTSDPIMQEEIFGPILPIVEVQSVAEAISLIQSREKPLAIYVFSNDSSISDLVVANTSSGGVLVNDTMLHFTADCLPFGGVGNSGMGSYHGRLTFDTFVHKKPTLVKNLKKLGEMLSSSRYPPYNDSKIRFLTTVTKKYPLPISLKKLPYIFAFFVGVGVTVLTNCILRCGLHRNNSE